MKETEGIMKRLTAILAATVLILAACGGEEADPAPPSDVGNAPTTQAPETGGNTPLADDDGGFPQRIDRWHPHDHTLQTLFTAETEAGGPLTTIEHAAPPVDVRRWHVTASRESRRSQARSQYGEDGDEW